MASILFVGLGGFIGSISRYLLGQLITSPKLYPTMIINLIGSFIIGLSFPLIHSKSNSQIYYLLVPGILGGFTTFSAFSAEAIELFNKGQYTEAMTYILMTVLGGLIFCALGFYLTRGHINT